MPKKNSSALSCINSNLYEGAISSDSKYNFRSTQKWMEYLPDELKQLPIINLSIPGSHDSMTYSINVKSGLAPDADDGIKNWFKLFPCFVRRWAKTQSFSVQYQLDSGIRYLDLRFALNPVDKKFYFVHAVYCLEVTEPLNEIKEFLLQNPCEVIILDCQHFYNMQETDFKALSDILFNVFGKQIYGRSEGTLKDLTLEMANEKGYQVIIIFRNNCGLRTEFWPGFMWPTPWPNKISVKSLKEFLECSINTRPADVGYVSQCVLTPNVDFIIPRFYSSLRNSCAQVVNKKLKKWIENQVPGIYKDGESPTINVFIADYINLQNCQFCKIVIELNYKILNEERERASK